MQIPTLTRAPRYRSRLPASRSLDFETSREEAARLRHAEVDRFAPNETVQNQVDMPRLINGDSLRAALAANGWDEGALARAVGVSSSMVCSWLDGKDFPAPPTLLKLATVLALPYDDLVVSQRNNDHPVVSPRWLAGGLPTNETSDRGRTQAALLEVLVPFLPKGNLLRTQILLPSADYDRLQSTVRSVRERIGLGAEASLSFEHLTGEFEANGAVILPVLWGNGDGRLAALRVRFPRDELSFVYLNLDVDIPSFTYTVAQELARVYVSDLADDMDGETYADAFAGALLFPAALARSAYAEASAKPTKRQRVAVLEDHAARQSVPLGVAIAEVERHASATGQPPLIAPSGFSWSRMTDAAGESVAQRLFNPQPPSAGTLIAASRHVFKSPVFPALSRMIHESSTGPGFVQQLLDCAMADAVALHRELGR